MVKIFSNNKKNIKETLYKCSKNKIDFNKCDMFFRNEIKNNIRIVFNCYNYLVSYNRNIEAELILNKYFSNKNLINIYKKNKNIPLYINNLKANSDHKTAESDSSKKVSVIMTAFNSESTILYALYSLLNQTYKNLEIIIVDDGSTDETINKLLQVEQQSKLKIIKLHENKGTYIAKNIGLYYAKGHFITFHDSDDWAHPQRIEEHMKIHLKHNNIKYSISKLVRISESGLLYSKEIYPIDRLSMVSLMIDKTIVNKVGYFRQYRVGSDLEYFERLKKFTNDEFYRIDKVLMFCAHRKNSLTRDNEMGVYEFSNGSKRKHIYTRWNHWHNKLIKEKRKPFVSFDHKKYRYKIISP